MSKFFKENWAGVIMTVVVILVLAVLSTVSCGTVEEDSSIPPTEVNAISGDVSSIDFPWGDFYKYTDHDEHGVDTGACFMWRLHGDIQMECIQY